MRNVVIGLEHFHSAWHSHPVENSTTTRIDAHNYWHEAIAVLHKALSFAPDARTNEAVRMCKGQQRKQYGVGSYLIISGKKMPDGRVCSDRVL